MRAWPVLIVLVAVLGAAAPSTAATTCPAGQLAIPRHVGAGTVTLTRTAKGKASCVAFGQSGSDPAAAKLLAYQHKLVVAKVRKLRSKRVRKATAATNTALDKAIGAHLSARQSGAEPHQFATHDGNTTVSGTETSTPVTGDGVGTGTDSVNADSVTKDGATTVSVHEVLHRNSHADGCPATDGTVTGEVRTDTEKTTRTQVGDGPVTKETSEHTRLTDFTAYVGEDANVSNVKISHTDRGESHSKLDWDAPSVETTATHWSHSEATLAGSELGGQPTGGVRSSSSSQHAGAAHALDALADGEAAHAFGDLGKDDVSVLLAAAKAVWQTPNRCAVATYTGDGQSVHKGGTADATAALHRRGYSITTRQAADTAPQVAIFTATDTCGTTLDHAVVESTLADAAKFHETDGAQVWQKPRTEGCLALRGTSRVGVTTGTLHFPIADGATFTVTVTGQQHYDYTATGSFNNDDGTASQCDGSSSASGSLVRDFTSDPDSPLPATATLGSDQTLTFSDGIDSDGTSTLTGTSHSQQSGDGCGDSSYDAPTDGCGSRTDQMHPDFTTTGDTLHFQLVAPASDRSDCPDAAYPDSSNPVEPDPTATIPWSQLSDPNQKTVAVHVTGSDSGDENCSDNQDQGCGNGEGHVQTYDTSGTETDDFTVTFTRQS